MTSHPYIIIISTIVLLVSVYVYVNVPKEFPDRLAIIPTSKVDNEIYHEFDWWSPYSPMSILRRMNKARVPYFHNILKLNHTSISKYVDIGCGGGLLTEAMAADLGYDITGVDLSANSLKHARKHAEDMNVTNVQYVQGSAYKLPIETGTIDGVIISDVLDHLSDLRLAMSEIKRILKPNGLLVFDTINRTWESYLIFYLLAQEIVGVAVKNTHDWTLFVTVDEMKKLLIEEGFIVGDNWKGISLVVNAFNFFHEGNKYTMIESFHLSDDLTQTYAGWAVKK